MTSPVGSVVAAAGGLVANGKVLSGYAQGDETTGQRLGHTGVDGPCLEQYTLCFLLNFFRPGPPLSVCLSVCVSVCLNSTPCASSISSGQVRLSVCLSVSVCLSQSVCLVCLSVSLCICFHLLSSHLNEENQTQEG